MRLTCDYLKCAVCFGVVLTFFELMSWISLCEMSYMEMSLFSDSL